MKRIFSVLLLLAVGLTPLAAQTTSGTAVVDPKVEFEKYTLPNGLQVVLHVDRKLPIVHVNQWYHVGSKNEKEGRTGFAHLFEHMMFQGSKNAPGEYFTYVESAGANVREGGVNGTTSQDRTNYFATVPSGNLEYLLWVESDRLATLLDAVDVSKLDNQREVVRNERRQGLENQPYGRWYTLMVENLHPANHPYSWSVIGSHEDLQAATVEDVSEFFRRYYTPNNLTLVIAGDFDPAEAKRLVEKYFGGIPAGPALDRPALFIPKLEGEKIIEVADRVPQERTYFGWVAPPYFSADEAALDIASTILTDGLSSRLNKALVYDRQLATNISSFNNAGEISGLFAVIANARTGQSLEEIEQVVTAEIAKLAKSGPTAEEVSRARTKWEYDFVTGLERIGGFGGKADRLAQYNTFLGDPGKFAEDLARYRDVTPASVKAAVSRWLDTKDRVLIRFHPETSSRSPQQVAVDRSQVPALGGDRAFTTPEVKTARLSNGMDLYVVERNDLPKVAVRLATRAGSVADPAGKAGTAQLTMATIDMGTKTRKALDIETDLGDLGTSLFGGAGPESSTIGYDVLSRNLGESLQIFADVVRNPTFPEEEFDREKKRHLDALAQQSNNPNAVAARVRPMLTFGADHPYGRPAQGLPGTVAAITRDDVMRFHQDRWKPGSSALILAGDLTLEQAKALAEKAFGTWSGGAAPAISIPAPAPAPRGRVYLIDRQDAAQTVVVQAMPAPARSSADYYTLRLVDNVWGGGGFGTRLNLNLREDKGYSYGVFSGFAPLSEAGAWWASGGVQTDKTKESLVEFNAELQGLATNKPITGAELTTAKERWTRGYAQQFESLGRVAGQISDLWRFGLPLSELQREATEPATITLQQVEAATKRYVRPQDATLILVGDRAKIEEGVRSLNLGEIVILDAEGNVIPQP
ncbi:MAG TPA: pitrilysin family protein [Thermoanaerobaculia bacterium]|nr:pitrilysin family protein [Thermoanaerobaculia bacterium]